MSAPPIYLFLDHTQATHPAPVQNGARSSQFPQLINFQRYNSACRDYFQKPPDRIVHLSNLFSTTKTELAYMAFCAPPLHNSLYHPFVRPFTSFVTPLSRACGHLITCLMQLLLQTRFELLRGYLASVLTILRALQQNHHGQTKALSRSQQHHSSYWSSFCLFYSHLTQDSTISLSVQLKVHGSSLCTKPSICMLHPFYTRWSLYIYSVILYYGSIFMYCGVLLLCIRWSLPYKCFLYTEEHGC